MSRDPSSGGVREDISHVYSYNKVMSWDCLEAIAKALNRTNFKILAWYINPKDTEECGVRNVKLLFKKPMNSTGSERFSVYVYYKTECKDRKEND